ncbi:MAG: preprotein translocase subunit SecE [Candidatus Omnitrophica bacterium]|nr:preprotein translocase subunit SecE [Candidatus Omnitrophota bacterium]
MIGKVKKFFSEILVELKKVSWSTKKELIESTWIVIISSAFLGIFIGVIDFFLSRIIGLIIK